MLTPGQTHETQAFAELIEGVGAGTRCLLGDRGYDVAPVREPLLLRGILPVIPAKRGRKEPAAHDAALYRQRNRIERLVGRLKQWRAIATRYDKTACSFLSFVHLASTRLWLQFVHAA